MHIQPSPPFGPIELFQSHPKERKRALNGKRRSRRNAIKYHRKACAPIHAAQEKGGGELTWHYGVASSHRWEDEETAKQGCDEEKDLRWDWMNLVRGNFVERRRFSGWCRVAWLLVSCPPSAGSLLFPTLSLDGCVAYLRVGTRLARPHNILVPILTLVTCVLRIFSV